ncbi:MAG: NAD-dependent epimerase/dehydratase family protein [Actinomycetota bacterium]|nr:NAD-dependent epimerase/dehydratase family protein [Actinomycetota bacterium]
MANENALTWTIGAGGLIGSGINRRAATAFDASAILWADNEATLRALALNLTNFKAQVASGPWTIIWAAGAATVASSETETAQETLVLMGFLELLKSAPPQGAGVFFLVSSAGGVFAGASDPPFGETSEPNPISPYGFAKLANEQLAQRILGDSCQVIIGRFSNIYGPGQKLDKLQGLISRLALSAVTKEPINIFVPLSTVRDYIYVDDAAAFAHAWINTAHARNATSSNTPKTSTVKLIAAGQGTSIGQLIRITQDVSHRKVPIAMGSHPSSTVQAADLRFIPSNPKDVDLPVTSMPVGVKHVVDSILRQLQQSEVK